MTDVIDDANELADMHLRHALEDQRRRAARLLGTEADASQWRVLSAADCEGADCAAPIPDIRRQLLPGVRLCVDCQARLERGYGA